MRVGRPTRPLFVAELARRRAAPMASKSSGAEANSDSNRNGAGGANGEPAGPGGTNAGPTGAGGRSGGPAGAASGARFRAKGSTAAASRRQPRRLQIGL